MVTPSPGTGPRRPRWAAGLCVAVLACTLPSGCGSATSGHRAGDPSTLSGQTHDVAIDQSTDRASCERVVLNTLSAIGQRIYAQASSGRIVEEAMHRLLRSRALVKAVKRGDANAARGVLERFLRDQIVRVRVIREGRTLLDIGSSKVLAPHSAQLRDAQGRIVGTLIISVHTDRSLADTTHMITGADVLVRRISSHASQVLASTLSGRVLRSSHQTAHRRLDRGRRHHGKLGASVPHGRSMTVDGRRYHTVSFPGRAFGGGPLLVTMLIPSSSRSCTGGSRQEIEADTIGTVATRLYGGELSGVKTKKSVALVERDAAFRQAVAQGNPTATRAAIVSLFRAHLHVVRVRAFLGSRLVFDLGGPFVLAPAEGLVRNASGRIVGHFLLSIQDDLGYVLLAHGFTGAQVLLRAGARQVMGTLSPGPARIPNRGPVSYGGQSYQAFSFSAEAFPAGPLRISLLMPTN